MAVTNTSAPSFYAQACAPSSRRSSSRSTPRSTSACGPGLRIREMKEAATDNIVQCNMAINNCIQLTSTDVMLSTASSLIPPGSRSQIRTVPPGSRPSLAGGPREPGHAAVPRARKVNCIGLAQNLGQPSASSGDFHPNCPTVGPAVGQFGLAKLQSHRPDVWPLKDSGPVQTRAQLF